ncbi:hypothetical protein Rwratislav_31639 [Rhodococcus wratislaviensis IFP 2016]|nr:hypothetical protein Rwratislav_31639 [Rhodococcus wratislaviensis IFP 2016]
MSAPVDSRSERKARYLRTRHVKPVDLRATATPEERAKWPTWTVPPRENWGVDTFFEPGERVQVDPVTGTGMHTYCTVPLRRTPL